MNGATDNQSLITLEQASVQFGRVLALHPLSLSICAGESVALIGSNGSGKSTLLRLMQGLIAPTQGKVLMADRKRQAFVFQRPWMIRATVRTNVALAAWLQGQSWKQAQQSAIMALKQVDLDELASRPARTLSGGQQQRLAVARACVSQPRMLLLDEPTASLSPQHKAEMEQLLAQLKSSGMTLVFSSHNLGQVKRLATRVIALDAGRAVFDGSMQDYFSAPKLRES